MQNEYKFQSNIKLSDSVCNESEEAVEKKISSPRFKDPSKGSSSKDTFIA